MMKNKSILFILLLSLNLSLKAQHIMATEYTQSYINLLLANLNEEDKIILENTNKTFNLQVVLVLDSLQQENFDSIMLDNELTNLNKLLAPIGFNFAYNYIQRVPYSEYAEIDSLTEVIDLEALFPSNQQITLFLVDSVLKPSVEQDYVGFTYLPNEPQKNYIYLQKSDVGSNHLAHLTGTFFGLLPTHFYNRGTEHPDGRNCREAGDFICDTYADPNLLNQVDANCIYRGFAYYQEFPFTPSVANIMSYSPYYCRCIFTEGQLKRMLYYYYNYRDYL